MEQEKAPEVTKQSSGQDDDQVKGIPQAPEKVVDEEQDAFQAVTIKPKNEFADAPKKLDEVFGDIRKSEPVPEVMPLDVDRNVAVYYQTGAQFNTD